MTKQPEHIVSDGSSDVRYIVSGRLQQEFNPDHPDIRDWFVGFPGKEKCAYCYEGEIVTLQELNEQRKKESEG